MLLGLFETYNDSQSEIGIQYNTISVKTEAVKRESRVEMLTERMRHKFFVRLLRLTKRAPVTAYRTIAAISTWASGITE